VAVDSRKQPLLVLTPMKLALKLVFNPKYLNSSH